MPCVPQAILSRNWPFFPLQPGTKVPRAGSHGWKDAVPRAADDGWRAPDENYGIALRAARLLVADFDRPDKASEWVSRLPPTLRVRTKRGEHMFYTLPEGWEPPTKGISVKFPFGEIQWGGYVVGAGSERDGITYELVDDQCNPVEAPEWLLDYVRTTARGVEKSNVAGPGVGAKPADGLDCIPDGGGRDDFLVAIAGTGRKWGLSERGLQRLLKGALVAGAVEQGDKPKTSADVRRIAHSIAKHAPEPDALQTARDGVVFADQIELVGPPIKWWIRGFIPRNELVMLFGKGGIGKSTFASHVAARVTAAGGRFLFIGVEEPFTRFAWRVVLDGGRRELLAGLDRASSVILPAGTETIAEIVRESNVDFVYFDSINTHFSRRDGQNSAERARQSLGPLAELAQSAKITVLANFHENKAGEYLGSTEMVNVARQVLRASRVRGKALIVESYKTNLKEPEVKLAFGGEMMVLADPATGDVQLEELEDGTLVPEELLIARRLEDVPIDCIEAGDIPDESDLPFDDGV